MRLSRFVLTGLPVIACVASASVARAAPTANQVYVLEVATEDADDQAKALTAALKARMRASKDLSLADADVSLQVMLIALKCGDVPDVACQSKIAEKLNAEKYIWGTMRKQAPNQVVADLHYWQKGKAEVRQQFTYTDNMTDAADAGLVRLSDQMVQRLVNFGKVGTVRLSAEHSVDGRLYVDGADAGTFTNGQAELTLPIGEHRFEVRASGKVLASGTAKLVATSPIDLQLVSSSKASAEPPKEQTPGNGSWKRPAGYAGVGVGAALILGGVYSMVKVNSINHDSGFDAYRKGFGPNEDVCSRAAANDKSPMAGAAAPGDVKSQCDSGSTFQTLQYVFFGLGAVVAGAGTYLLVTAPNKESSTTAAADPPPPKVQVVPRGGQHGGGVDVRVVF